MTDQPQSTTTPPMYDVEITIVPEQETDHVVVNLHPGLHLDIAVSPNCPPEILAFLAPQIANAIKTALHDKPWEGSTS